MVTRGRRRRQGWEGTINSSWSLDSGRAFVKIARGERERKREGERYDIECAFYVTMWKAEVENSFIYVERENGQHKPAGGWHRFTCHGWPFAWYICFNSLFQRQQQEQFNLQVKYHSLHMREGKRHVNELIDQCTCIWIFRTHYAIKLIALDMIGTLYLLLLWMRVIGKDTHIVGERESDCFWELSLPPLLHVKRKREKLMKQQLTLSRIQGRLKEGKSKCFTWGWSYLFLPLYHRIYTRMKCTRIEGNICRGRQTDDERKSVKLECDVN